jgi:hypothetical protein
MFESWHIVKIEFILRPASDTGIKMVGIYIYQKQSTQSGN